MNIKPIFSVPIGLAQNPNHKYIEKKLVMKCKQLKDKIIKGGDNWEVGTFNTCSTYNIHTDEVFSKLNNWIFDQIIKYADQIGYKQKQISCTQSWFNFYKQYDFQEEHEHFDKNDIVCVYFLHGGTDTGDLILKSPLPFERTATTFDSSNPYTFKKFWVKPESGSLIIFKSNLIHSVNQNKTKKNRISLAYNFSIQ